MRLKPEDVPTTLKAQTMKVIQKLFEDFLASIDSLPFPTDADLPDFVRASAAGASPTVPSTPVTALDKEDKAQVLNAIEGSSPVFDLNELAQILQPSGMHKSHTISTAGTSMIGAADDECETTRTRRRSSSGASDKPDGLESEEGAADTPRKSEKHHSARMKASTLFKKFRMSLSTKKKGHMSAGVIEGQDDDSSGSGGSSSGTPTTTNPPPPPAAANSTHVPLQESQPVEQESSGSLSPDSSMPAKTTPNDDNNIPPPAN